LISFFERSGFTSGKVDSKEVATFISKMKDKWISYDIKYEVEPSD
jgi:hypothetical protein